MAALQPIERAAELLRVVVKLIQENHLESYEVDYDGTTCDGYCLIEDLEIAEDDLDDKI